jgi:phenylalanyl-tRNA synthetase beta chain
VRVPLSWLSDLLGRPLSGDEAARRLTALGLEVEAVERLGEGLVGAVIAEIETLAPLGRNLRKLTVRTADGRHPVVTGAPNVAVGQRVPWAPPGARLPDGRTLAVATFLGEPSHGMLLSADEIGIGPDRDGILVLPPEAPLGADVAAYLGLPEVVLDIGLTPSFASYAQSVRGVARELAAAFEWDPPSMPAARLGEATPVPVAVDEGLCPLYVLLAAEVPAGARSPLWVARRLWAGGLRSHLLAVDATNYALLEFGHPVHAFDLDRLTPPLAVRRARPGESLETLDGRLRALHPEDLVIADANGPVALAGVMGGLASAVTDGTRRVLFEVAVFDPLAVRRTALRHGLRTEAMARFEKGVDPTDWPLVAARLDEILRTAGGRVLGVAAKVGDEPAPRTVALPAGEVRRLTGLDLSADEVVRLLARLGLEARPGPDGLEVRVPAWRHDLVGAADLVEEVVRLYGMDRLPATTPPAHAPGRLGEEAQQLRFARRELVALGLTEALSYSWVRREEAAAFPPPAGDPVEIENPLAEEEPVLRPSLLPRLLRALAQNRARQVADVRLFEVGRVFWREGDAVREEARAAVAAVGDLFARGPTTPGVAMDVLALKGLLAAFADRCGRTLTVVADASHPSLHPGRQGRLVVDGEPVGWMGEIHPAVAERLDVPEGAVVAEWRLDALTPAPRRGFRPLPRFPGVRRDIAVVVPEATPYGLVEAAVRDAGVGFLRRVRLFDVYRGEHLREGEKSLAIELWFQSDAGTLTDAEVEAAVAAVVASVGRVGGRLRA